MNDRRQGEGCNFSPNAMQSNKCSLLCVNNGQVPCRKPRYLGYCGTKKYHKGHGTGTVEKWCRGAAVVPWYRTTLQQSEAVNKLVHQYRNLKSGFDASQAASEAGLVLD